MLHMTCFTANTLQVWGSDYYLFYSQHFAGMGVRLLPVLQPTLCRYRSEGVRHDLFYSQHFAGIGVRLLPVL